MSIKKLTPLAESGDLESKLTFEEWVANGWSDERVWNGRLNRQLYRADTKLNEIIDYGPEAVAYAADAEAVYTSGVFSPAESVASPANTSNFIDTGHTGDIYDLTYASIDGSKKLIALEYDSAYYVRVYDIATLSLDETVAQATLEAALDTTGTQDWTPLSLCADLENLYVLFIENDASPEEYWIQAYRLSDFAKRDSWPTYGTQLSAYQQAYDAFNARIRNATSDVDGKLVISQPWRTVTSGTSQGLAIVDKTDGTVDGYGCGDCGTVTSGFVLGVCSNGTYVFAAISDNGNLAVCSMSIASPGATGGFVTAGTQPTISNSYFGGIACNGYKVVMGYTSGTDLFTLYTLNTGVTAHFATSDPDIAYKVRGVSTDGLSFWARGSRDAEGYSAEIEDMLFRLDGANFAGYSIPGEIYTETYSAGQNHVKVYRWQDYDGDNTGSASSTNERLLISDGSGLWIPANPYVGNTCITRFAKSKIR